LDYVVETIKREEMAHERSQDAAEEEYSQQKKQKEKPFFFAL